MSGARHGLRRRITAAFALFALATALCFSGFSLLFMYTVEDSFFDKMLEQEVAHQRSAGPQARPLRDFVSVHADSAGFPPDLARQFPARQHQREFFGDQGRHYHLLPLAPSQGYLVAEVSGELVVRPRIPFIATFLGVSTLAILLITLGLGYCFARRATRPLERLAQLVSDAAPGQLPQRFADQFPDNEIGALAHKLEQAMARISAFIEREQHFTRDASHELRTPLAVIDGAARLLDTQALTAQGVDQLQRIRGTSSGMLQTLDTLLALAREELDQSPAQPVALLALIESVVVEHAYLLDGKNVEVAIEVDAGHRAVCHRPALAILLSNLIGNAFSHTQQGEVRVSMQDQELVVADSGPGIAPGLAERLYQAGAKGPDSAGFGLGLSIARRLADRHGFTIAVAGGAKGGGTRATLRFAQPVYLERFHKPSAA